MMRFPGSTGRTRNISLASATSLSSSSFRSTSCSPPSCSCRCACSSNSTKNFCSIMGGCGTAASSQLCGTPHTSTDEHRWKSPPRIADEVNICKNLALDERLRRNLHRARLLWLQLHSLQDMHIWSCQHFMHIQRPRRQQRVAHCRFINLMQLDVQCSIRNRRNKLLLQFKQSSIMCIEATL